MCNNSNEFLNILKYLNLELNKKPSRSPLENASKPIHYFGNRLIKGKNQAFILTFLYELHHWATKQLVEEVSLYRGIPSNKE